MKDILLDINGLTKAYPGVVANNNVSFQIRRGEVHALLGENGAGKSTLVKMIYGLVKPDSGSMTFQTNSYASIAKCRTRHWCCDGVSAFFAI